jgi:acyl-CoA synthetase (NDP forming)
MSHTASLAGSFEAFRAACQQADLYLIEELTEDPKLLINTLSMLTTQKRAEGNRIGVVSVGGGAAILLADQLTTQGMRLAEFSSETRSRLSNLLLSKTRTASLAGDTIERIVSNPLDLFGDADDDRLIESLRILNADENTDVIVAGVYLQVPYLSEYIAERLLELRDEMTKPLIISPRGFSEYVAHTRKYLTENGVPTYTVPLVKSLAVALEVWKRYNLDFSST